MREKNHMETNGKDQRMHFYKLSNEWRTHVHASERNESEFNRNMESIN